MSEYSKEEIRGPSPALGSLSASLGVDGTGSGGRRHTVITLELWAAP